MFANAGCLSWWQPLTVECAALCFESAWVDSDRSCFVLRSARYIVGLLVFGSVGILCASYDAVSKSPVQPECESWSILCNLNPCPLCRMGVSEWYFVYIKMRLQHNFKTGIAVISSIKKKWMNITGSRQSTVLLILINSSNKCNALGESSRFARSKIHAQYP